MCVVWKGGDSVCMCATLRQVSVCESVHCAALWKIRTSNGCGSQSHL